MTPAEWNAALAPEIDWRKAYATVAGEARAYLAGRDDQINTTQLANALYPAHYADGNNAAAAARKRLFKALLAMAATELSDCASRGPARKLMGKTGRPWLWHRSTGPRKTLGALAVALLAAAEPLLDGGEDWAKLETAADALREYVEREKPAGAYEAYLAANS